MKLPPGHKWKDIMLLDSSYNIMTKMLIFIRILQIILPINVIKCISFHIT